MVIEEANPSAMRTPTRGYRRHHRYIWRQTPPLSSLALGGKLPRFRGAGQVGHARLGKFPGFTFPTFRGIRSQFAARREAIMDHRIADERPSAACEVGATPMPRFCRCRNA